MKLKWLGFVGVVALSCFFLGSQAQEIDTGGANNPEESLSVSIDVDPFTSVQVCTPFNILVAPSSGNYSLEATADPSVLAALSAAVFNGTLQIETQGTFSTNQTIQFTVWYLLFPN